MINNRKSGFTTLDKVLYLGLAAIILPLSFVGLRKIYHAGVESLIANHQPVQTTNVVGNERTEQFIEFKGKRFYSEIDGQPIEDYLKR
jgi:hypothetical protein